MFTATAAGEVPVAIVVVARVNSLMRVMLLLPVFATYTVPVVAFTVTASGKVPAGRGPARCRSHRSEC